MTRLKIDDAVAGDIRMDYTITGDEEQAQQLWMNIVELLKEHDKQYGDSE